LIGAHSSGARDVRFFANNGAIADIAAWRRTADEALSGFISI
jgi:hypothetical protein